jgi:hypothetical protein
MLLRQNLRLRQGMRRQGLSEVQKGRLYLRRQELLRRAKMWVRLCVRCQGMFEMHQGKLRPMPGRLPYEVRAREKQEGMLLLAPCCCGPRYALLQLQDLYPLCPGGTAQGSQVLLRPGAYLWRQVLCRLLLLRQEQNRRLLSGRRLLLCMLQSRR